MSDAKPMPAEEWRTAPGWDGLYEVSSVGRVRRVGSAKVRALGLNNAGYRNVALCGRGITKMTLVHRLVCRAFHGEPPAGHVVNHKNGVRGDNRVENLEWTTVAENCHHAMRNGHGRGERHSQSKLSEQQVLEIRKLAADGISRKKLGRTYGVYPSTISRILSLETWSHLKGAA